MKSFKLILAIILFSFLLDKLIYFTLNKVSDDVLTGQAIGKLNHFNAVKDTTKFIVFGSSRANHSLDPLTFNASSFNNGVDGTTIAYAATLILTLPEDTEQTIILHLEPSRVTDNNYKGEDVKFLVSKYHRNKMIRKQVNKLNQENALQSFYWSIDYNSKVLAILKNYFYPKYDYSTYNGFDPITLNQTQKAILKRTLENESMGDQPCSESIAPNKIYLDYLIELKDFCSNNNKKFVVFTSPKYSDQCKKDNKILSNILDELKIEYYDFTNFFGEENNLEYWRDLKHLSDIGAKLFSEHFVQVLNKMEN